MKRILGLVAAFVAVGTLTGLPAGASGNQVPVSSSANGVSAPKLLQRYLSWLLGSDSNPIFSGSCGEIVNGIFFLNVAASPGSTDYNCTIPVGVPVLASPGLAAVWPPSDGNTDAELLAALDTQYWPDLTDPSAALDGKNLPVGDAVSTGAFTMPLGANSLILAVDPSVPSTWTDIRAVGRAWLTRLHPLMPGSHTLVVSDTIDGDAYTATFHITVTHP